MKKKIDWGDNSSFIENYNKLKSSREMAKLYNCDKNSVLCHARKIGFDTSCFIPLISDEIKRIIIDSYYTKGSNELAEELGLPRGTITKIWHDNNLLGKKRKGSRNLNLEGKQFGKLRVLSPTEKRTSNGCVIWKCLCECGNEVEYPSEWLTLNKVVSCGCVSKQNLEIGRGLNFVDRTGFKYGKLTVIERCEDAKYKNNRRMVQWLCCCECGRLTKVASCNLQDGNTKSCGFCSNRSFGEDRIEKILKENNISFVREKRFDTCRYKNMLSFDFYINDSYCIEYDGKIHFDENSLFDFEYTKKRDEIKNQWCIKNDMPLIRIPYTHLDNITIDDLILETSKFVYNTNADNKSGKIGEG